MDKKAVVLMTTMAAAFVPVLVHAETLTSYDQRFTLDVPDVGWFETNDGMSLMAVTDTKNLVTVQEFARGQALYPPLIEFGDFAEIYQVYYTTANQVFQITGYIATEEDSKAVSSVVRSIQLADHQIVEPTPTEAPEETPKAEEEAKEEASEKENTETKGEGTEAEEEKEDAAETESSEKAENTEENAESVQPTGQAWSVNDANGQMLVLIEYTDGTVRDINGRIFQRDEYFNWIAEDGEYFYAQ